MRSYNEIMILNSNKKDGDMLQTIELYSLRMQTTLISSFMLVIHLITDKWFLLQEHSIYMYVAWI